MSYKNQLKIKNKKSSTSLVDPFSAFSRLLKKYIPYIEECRADSWALVHSILQAKPLFNVFEIYCLVQALQKVDLIVF
jgi:hypothetical protein